MTGFIFRYRWLIILFCIAAGIASVFIIPGMVVDPEIRNYVPSHLRSRIETDKIEKEFGVQDMVVILFTDSCIINKENLNRIRNIDHALSRNGGITTRISPFTVRSIKSEEGTMVAEPLIRKIPVNTSEIENLRKEITGNRFARDIVVSSDMTTASITATINNSIPERITLQKIDSAVNAYPGEARIIKGGLPYIRYYLLNDVGRDALILVPSALLIMLFILKANLGRWRAVMMPFSVVILSTAFSLALIPLVGWKMSIITLLLPVILIAVANNYGIYLVARFQELRMKKPGLSKHELVATLFGSLNMPILFSALTTIAGILGLLTHSIIPARQMGILAAAGISLALLCSLFLIPAFIFAGGSTDFIDYHKRKPAFPFDTLLTKLAGVITAKPGKILKISVSLVAVISSGIFLLRINTNQEDYFSKNHPVKKASQIINSKFGGSQTISVMISGDIKSPDVLKGIDMITEQTAKQKGVGNVASVSQVVREMSKAIYSEDEYGYDRIPDTREAVAQMFELYNMSGNADDFRQLMNLENTKAHILIRLSNPENRVIRNVKSGISKLTADFPAEVTMGGYAIIMDDFASSIMKGQASSLLFAVITVFILLAIIFRSVRGGLIGSIPLFTSILVLFGFMGFSGIALDAATALLSSIMIGVGVDFTIQYIWCFNLHIKNGLDYREATNSALQTIGRSIIINAVSVMGGFAALIFSGFTSIRFFGYLVIISIGSCLLGAIVFIPAYLIKFRPPFIGFDVNNNKRGKYEKKSDIVGVTTAAFAGNRAESWPSADS